MGIIEAIVLSIFGGALLYVLALKAVDNERTREFIIRNKWLHPNPICVYRVILAWIGLAMYFWCWHKNYGVACFTISAWLDAIDGVIARGCGLTTKFGKFFDPLCDKLTYMPALAIFTWEHQLLRAGIYWTLTFAEVFGQFFVRWLLNLLGITGAANWWGKSKTALIFTLVTICAVVVDFSLKSLLVVTGLEIIFGSCTLLAYASFMFKFFGPKEELTNGANAA